MQKFDFNIPTANLTLPMTDMYLSVEYYVQGSKVILNNIEIPPPLLPYLKDMYTLHDQIFKAAENNANSLGLIKPVTIVDAMNDIFNRFKMPA